MAKVTRITSRRSPLLARLRKLADDGASYRRLGVVLLEGEHLCAAWVARPGAPVSHAIVSVDAWDEPHLRRLAEAAAEVAIVDAATIGEIGTLDSPAPIAFLVPAPERATVVAGYPTLVLDRLQDPGNVGSVLRSAAAFGFVQAIALAGTAALWSPKVVRAGMGAHFGLRLVEGADEATLAELAVPLFGTSSHAAERLDGFALPWPCAWVFGHEGQGIAPAVAARCRAMLAIPQPGGMESLNVGAAAAVCLYETARQRGR
ncbi:MAG TPA: RNA methyltransferase [Caldimonas sp.]|nr:RNA methyltransferase [Caldimonas sp.]